MTQQVIFILIKPVNPKGNPPWIFTGRTDAEAEAPILCIPDANSLLTGKDPDSGKDWGQKKGAIEDKIVKEYYQHNGQNLIELWEIVKDRGARLAAVHGVTESDMT